MSLQSRRHLDLTGSNGNAEQAREPLGNREKIDEKFHQGLKWKRVVMWWRVAVRRVDGGDVGDGASSITARWYSWAQRPSTAMISIVGPSKAVGC
jgi:hypothetical protein